jgi:hypothetical protein
VRQVGYLLELYRDARSPEYKTLRTLSIELSSARDIFEFGVFIKHLEL